MPKERDPTGSSLMLAGGAAAVAVCCGGAALVGTLGAGTLLAIVVSPWVLVPTLVVAVSVGFWYRQRRACRTDTRRRAHAFTDEASR